MALAVESMHEIFIGLSAAIFVIESRMRKVNKGDCIRLGVTLLVF